MNIFNEFSNITEKEEEAARAVRKDQNTMSVEDVKKDFVRVQEQTNYLEEKIVSLQKLSESTGIDSRNKCKKNQIFILQGVSKNKRFKFNNLTPLFSRQQAQQ